MTDKNAQKISDFAVQADDLRTLIMGLTGPAPLPPETSVQDWLAHTRGHLARQPILHPRLSVFVGTHANVPPAGGHIHQIRLNNLQNADGPLAALCAAANADLRLYDLSAAPPELNAEHLVRAMSYGMMAVEAGVDFYTATATGPGMEQALSFPRKRESMTRQSIMDPRFHGGDDVESDPIAALMAIDGPHLAALAGLVIATQLAKKPIILEGAAGHAIVNILHRANPAAIAHVALITDDTNAPCPIIQQPIDPDVPGLALIQTMHGIITP